LVLLLLLLLPLLPLMRPLLPILLLPMLMPLHLHKRRPQRSMARVDVVTDVPTNNASPAAASSFFRLRKGESDVGERPIPFHA